MLSYALAIAVAISSLILFSTAFLMSKIHRKDDFLWSAVGLFYALILWVCARNITGTVLLGQAAATVLIVSYCWQTIKLRRVIANPALAAETKSFSVVDKLNRLFKRKPKLESPAPVVKPPTPKVTEQEIAIPEPTRTAPVKTSQAPATPIVEEPIPNDGDRQDTAIPTSTETPAPAPVQSFQAPATSIVEESIPSDGDRQDTAISKKTTIAPTQSSPPPATLTAEEPIFSDRQDLQSQDIKPTQEQSNSEGIEYQPLPNKLPEITTQAPLPVEPQPEKPTIKPIEQVDNLVTEAAPAVEQQTNKDNQDNVPQPQTKPTPEVITPEAIAFEAKTESSFDSLEVVEVAEVLEAETDNVDKRRQSDRDNIIEVTTTEINVVTETQKINRDRTEDDRDREN